VICYGVVTELKKVCAALDKRKCGFLVLLQTLWKADTEMSFFAGKVPT